MPSEAEPSKAGSGSRVILSEATDLADRRSREAEAAEPGHTALLRARGLVKTFKAAGKPDFTAVDGVSFEVAPGQVLGIVGESGSGKSTVARMVTRLLDVTDGTVELLGVDITHARGRGLREVYGTMQMVFQAPMGSFDSRRTLGDGIGEGLRNRSASRAQARQRSIELLEQCGLSADFADRFPHQVSGGECQRAALARALAVGPRLLVLDEPTSALDVTVQRQIMNLLAELRGRYGLSYVFICHNLALVQDLCDQMLVMHQGRVVDRGTPDEVIFSPRSEYTKRLVDAAW